MMTTPDMTSDAAQDGFLLQGTGEGLVVSSLTKRFGRPTALSDISLTLRRQTIYGLLGENGAGKSTLLRLLAGRSLPTSGRVSLDGLTVTEDSALMGDILLVTEGDSTNMRAKGYFRSVEQSRGGFDWAFARTLVARFALPTDRRISALSTGYRMIARIVAALCAPCEFVLLDEPTAGMDVRHRRLFTQSLLEAYARHPRTFVISSHLITEIAPVISDAVILHHGHVLADGPVDDLLSGAVRLTGSTKEMEGCLASLGTGADILSREDLPGEVSAVVRPQADGTDITGRITFPDIEASLVSLQELFLALTDDGTSSQTRPASPTTGPETGEATGTETETQTADQTAETASQATETEGRATAVEKDMR